MTIYFKALATAFPEQVIDNSFFEAVADETQNPMFMGTKFRRHVGRDLDGSDLIAQAVKNLERDEGVDLKTDIDILITNVSVPDAFFMGSGAVVCKKTGLSARWIYDLHNTGCISFVFMLDLAASLMKAHGARSALVCSAQTAGGRLAAHPSHRGKPESAIPGDGCGVAYLANEGRSEVLCSVLENYPDFAEDMYMTHDDGRRYWEPGQSSPFINFNDEKVAMIMARGNELVPDVVRKVCDKAGVEVGSIDHLITNQPNLHFLKNWHEALGIPSARHHHTFERYANLFGAGVPITLAETVAAGKIRSGELVCLAGFSHAGDYAGATLVRW